MKRTSLYSMLLIASMIFGSFALLGHANASSPVITANPFYTNNLQGQAMNVSDYNFSVVNTGSFPTTFYHVKTYSIQYKIGGIPGTKITIQNSGLYLDITSISSGPVQMGAFIVIDNVSEYDIAGGPIFSNTGIYNYQNWTFSTLAGNLISGPSISTYENTTLYITIAFYVSVGTVTLTGYGYNVPSVTDILIPQQIPYGTYTLPQFSPFSTFSYTSGNLSVAKNGNYLNVSTSSSSSNNYLYANDNLTNSGSYYINGSYYQSANVVGAYLGFDNTIYIGGGELFNVPSQGRFLAAPSSPWNATYSILVNNYNKSAVVTATISSTDYYLYSAIPATLSGNITIAVQGTADWAISIPTITQKTYPVIFNTGLTYSQGLTVSIAGKTISTSQSSTSLDLTTGNYTWSATVGTNTYNGYVIVSGDTSSYTVNIIPSSEIYTVTFTESGLPSGTPWGIWLSQQEQTTMTNAIGFKVLAGSYNFQVQGIANYTSDPTGYNAFVNSNQSITIQFNASAANHAALLNMWQFDVFIAGAGAVIIAIGIIRWKT